jgi:hypothetical protein
LTGGSELVGDKEYEDEARSKVMMMMIVVKSISIESAVEQVNMKSWFLLL